MDLAQVERLAAEAAAADVRDLVDRPGLQQVTEVARDVTDSDPPLEAPTHPPT